MVKKFWCITLSFVTLLLIICFFATSPKLAGVSADEFLVVIDPGHGGIDPGVLGAELGTREADLNLILAKNLRSCFYEEGVATVLTRTADVGLYGTIGLGFKVRDLKKRVDIAHNAGADIFISVHMNEFSSPTRRGAQVFYKPDDEDGMALAQSIQSFLNGLDSQTRSYSALAGDYYLLNNLNCPSVIVECGFLSSPEDEKLFQDENYRQQVAYAIFNGVMHYVNG